MGKVYKKNFVPASRPEAKNTIKNEAFTMCENDYNLTHKAKIEDHIQNKSKILHGEFLCSKAFDNAHGPDWSKKTHAERMTGAMKNAGLKRNTLQNTGDNFIQGGNKYEQHLMDFDEMPRLSILNNYKRIKQIMNTNYVNGFKMEQKYRNRTKQDSD